MEISLAKINLGGGGSGGGGSLSEQEEYVIALALDTLNSRVTDLENNQTNP